MRVKVYNFANRRALRQRQRRNVIVSYGRERRPRQKTSFASLYGYLRGSWVTMIARRVAVTYYRKHFRVSPALQRDETIAIILVKFETGLEMHTEVTTCLLVAHAWQRSSKRLNGQLSAISISRAYVSRSFLVLLYLHLLIIRFEMV